MRALIVAIGVIGLGGGVASAGPATGAMFELRYAPESDTNHLPLANSYFTLGYLDERIAFGVSIGVSRNTLDDSTNGTSMTQSLITVGPTIRGVFARTHDGSTALIGEGTATLTDITSSMTFTGSGQSPPPPQPTPVRFEVGLGIRHWIVPELGIGATLLGRYTYASLGDQTTTQISLGGAVYLVGVL